MKKVIMAVVLMIFVVQSAFAVSDYETFETDTFSVNVPAGWVYSTKNEEIREDIQRYYYFGSDIEFLSSGCVQIAISHIELDQNELDKVGFLYDYDLDVMKVIDPVSYDIMVGDWPARVWSGTLPIKGGDRFACGFKYSIDGFQIAIIYINPNQTNEQNIYDMDQMAKSFHYGPPQKQEPVTAYQVEYNIDGMSFDELLALKEQINAALWASEEWQEVTVPAGVYEIGRDIPAGHWTIRPVDGDTASLYLGSALDESKTAISSAAFMAYEQITSPTDSYPKINNIEFVSWELTEGTYLVINSSAVIFTPFAGLDLGFK